MNLTDGRQRSLQPRQQLLDAIHDADDVGAGLALNVDDDGGVKFIQAACRAFSAPSITLATSDRRTGAPFLVGNNDVAVFVAAEQLVVGVDGVGLALAIEHALGLINVGLSEHGAQIFQAQTIRRQAQSGSPECAPRASGRR